MPWEGGLPGSLEVSERQEGADNINSPFTPWSPAAVPRVAAKEPVTQVDRDLGSSLEGHPAPPMVPASDAPLLPRLYCQDMESPRVGMENLLCPLLVHGRSL